MASPLEAAIRERVSREGAEWLAALLPEPAPVPVPLLLVIAGRRSGRKPSPPKRLSPPTFRARGSRCPATRQHGRIPSSIQQPGKDPHLVEEVTPPAFGPPPSHAGQWVGGTSLNNTSAKCLATSQGGAELQLPASSASYSRITTSASALLCPRPYLQPALLGGTHSASSSSVDEAGHCVSHRQPQLPVVQSGDNQMVAPGASGSQQSLRSPKFAPLPPSTDFPLVHTAVLQPLPNVQLLMAGSQTSPPLITSPQPPLSQSLIMHQVPTGGFNPSQAADTLLASAIAPLQPGVVSAESSAISTAAASNVASPGLGRSRRGRRRHHRSSSSSYDSDRGSYSRRSRHSHRRRRCSISCRSRRSRYSRYRSSSSSGSHGRASRRNSPCRSRDEQPGQAAQGGPTSSVIPVPEAPVEIPGACSIGQSARSNVPGLPLGGAGGPLMPLVRASIASSTWTAYGCSRPSVWVLGHSYVYWAGQRAKIRPGGKSLGFVNAEVNWRGIRGLTWSQVLPEVGNISRTAVGPVVLVLHAGGNDLCSIQMTELLTLMLVDIDKFPAFFSQVVIVWSETVPRVVLRGARDWAGMERTRRTINHRISRFVHFKGRVIVRYRQLEGTNARLMRPDGVHLNEIGLDIFLSGLQDGIEEALFVLGGGL
ncbi:uncharacterized protein LOC142245371 isoform X2 [Anomaloglossus baeobatrachus]|uniref:uncharacterized protein LOC142245371 isoform X2 n=1 Tax=Anomaloglossus baeobatrachus TaxID=238106 RepID=UPI003F4FB446